ncbi:MAG TPA: hypothetical protein VJY15_08380 [Candidatus Acidoferrum sp.]|nr:hypothetical protein [Candidatus Acidoferrum sp.]
MSTRTLLLPSGLDESVAVGLAGQLKFSVVLPNVNGLGNEAFGFEIATFTGSNSRIAPNAPVRGMLNGPFPPVTLMLSVAVSRTPGFCDGLNVTLIAQDPGAPIVFDPEGLIPHVSVSVKSLEEIWMLLTVTVPLPATLMITVSGALTVLPVGTPKERLPGDTVTL